MQEGHNTINMYFATMAIFSKMPGIVQKFFPKRIWKVETEEKVLYLSFDDGPHPLITRFVLAELEKYNANASFFCIGKNVAENPATYAEIQEAGHAIGNHTHNHLNGFKTDDETYLANVAEAKKHIDSSLFRPPYGRLTGFQAQQLAAPAFGLTTIMWSVLSMDYDKRVTPQECLENVTLQAVPGDIIVFHDSEKAAHNMLYALPRVLQYFSANGYRFDKLDEHAIKKGKR